MENQDKNPDPQRLSDILPDVLDVIEGRTVPPPERASDASMDYEEGNNAVLRDAAQQPGVKDETVAELSGLIHEGEVAIEALKKGEGHSPRKPE